MKTQKVKKMCAILTAVSLAIFTAAPIGFAATASVNQTQGQSETTQPTKSATDVQQPGVQQPPVSQQEPATTTDFVMPSTALRKVVKDESIVGNPPTSISITPEVLVQQKIDQLTQEIADAARAAAEAMKRASQELEKAAKLNFQAHEAEALAAQFAKQGSELLRRAQEALARHEQELAAQLMARAHEAIENAALQRAKAASLFRRSEASKEASHMYTMMADRYQELAVSKTHERSTLEAAKPRVIQLSQEIVDAREAATVAKIQAKKELARAEQFVSQSHAAAQQATLFKKQASELTKQAHEALANGQIKLAQQLFARAQTANANAVKHAEKAAKLMRQAAESFNAAQMYTMKADHYQQVAALKAHQLADLLKSLGIS